MYVDRHPDAGVARLELLERLRASQRPDRAARRPSSADDVEPFGNREDASATPDELEH